MGVFTLDASNIEGIAFKFARPHPVWIGPKRVQEKEILDTTSKKGPNLGRGCYPCANKLGGGCVSFLYFRHKTGSQRQFPRIFTTKVAISRSRNQRQKQFSVVYHSNRNSWNLSCRNGQGKNLWKKSRIFPHEI